VVKTHAEEAKDAETIKRRDGEGAKIAEALAMRAGPACDCGLLSIHEGTSN
jgi:hypothetical protein